MGFPADSAARQFFVMEYLFGLGVQYVVGLSQTREKDSALYAGHYMDHAQVSLHLILADMALRMTKGHQQIVLQLMLLMHTEVENRFHRAGMDCLPSIISYPQSEADLRRVYLDGAFSIAQNVPIPNIYNCSNHSYILPSDMIRHVLAHGIDVDTTAMAATTGLFSTKMGKEAVARISADGALKLVMWVSGWSDDFDPNNTAKNKGSVWAFTLTMCTPTHSKHKWHNSAVIALAPKKSDHRSVIKAFTEDINELSRTPTPMYLGGSTKIIAPVQVWLATMVQDTLARREYAELAGARGLFSTVFGVSLIVSRVKHSLPSCPDCLISRRDGIARPTCCSECADWNVLSPLLKFQAPANYPTGDYSDCDMKDDCVWLDPLPLKFSLLKEQTLKACLLGMSGVWRMSQVKVFLQRLQLSDHLIKCLFSFVRSNLDMIESKYGTISNESLFQLLTVDSSITGIFPYPPAWGSLEDDVRQAHSVAIMHLLGLNHGKAILERVFLCMKRRKKFSLYTRDDGVLARIIHWKLAWCKMLSFKDGSVGDFLSANFMASNRLLIWLCSAMDTLFAGGHEEENSHHPNTPGRLWDKPSCERWLRERGLMDDDCAMMRVQILRQHIATIMAERPDTPLLLFLEGASMADISNMVIAHHGFTSRALDGEGSAPIIGELDNYVKLYLSYVLELDRKNHFNDQKHVPSFVNAPVYLDLLNLSEQMRKFGPLVQFWEG